METIYENGTVRGMLAATAAGGKEKLQSSLGRLVGFFCGKTATHIPVGPEISEGLHQYLLRTFLDQSDTQALGSAFPPGRRQRWKQG
jgi:hypothetical protein